MAEGKGYENFYPGTLSPLDYPAFQSADYGELFTGYRVPMSQIAMSTDPRTANIIGEVSTKLSQGMKSMEVTQTSQEVFEAIPKQHFKEVERIGKLTGMDFSFHAPIVEPSGFTRDGWSNWSREESERQLQLSIDRAHEMSPKGNIPVTIHASQLPAYEWSKDKGLPKDKTTIYAIDQESQQLLPIKHEMKYYPEYDKAREYIPEERLNTINDTHWSNNVTQLLYYKQRADEMMKHGWNIVGGIYNEIKSGKIKREQLNQEMRRALNDVDNAMLFYTQQIVPQFREMYDEASKYAPEKAQVGDRVVTRKDIMKGLKEIGNEWNKLRQGLEERKATPMDFVDAYDDILKGMSVIPAPQHYVPVEDFAKKHSAKTLANTALHGYLKYGKNAPIVSVENVFPNTAFGRSESLKGLIKESRKKFIEEAEKKGVSQNEAERAAEKLIGATWDVGHINMLRKYGYDKADVVKETKEIAPFVKHVHISDNFGMEHIELPPGMGNVPMKEMLEELEKKGYSGKKIIEAAHWWQHFSQGGKVSPLPYVAEAFGSPLYGMMQAPYWNQMRGVQGNYMAGPMTYMPEQHFSLYGGGWSSLPTELGGQIPGKQSRFSGAPTE